ncbi:CerR family C-terminal domain-containing protein [Candidatus Nitrotoga sp. AM1P]|uniref:CerR family C-terminal domain-containing protein n=1 Tax=Candidatus Nitrotoga sp. AM1P TaxID=2559597 RepID=UPI0010B9EDB3|nr:CerR family C-terminal domain-containing protein [Candidatus Nitrotoga sp. AM1P]BBJ24500.1 TetR family transcriptional regulator [Candidatus Nitrotoga sp. AM1P]
MITETKISLSEQTRERLLAAARVVFSENGFQNATVREICRHAEVNIAAVNYYFSSKEALFAATLNFEPLLALCKKINQDSICAQVRLLNFIHDFLMQLLDKKEFSVQCQFMARELAEPTPVLGKIVQEAIVPIHQFVASLVREIVGNKISEAELRRCVFSIFGQCVYYRHGQSVIQRLHPNLSYDHKEIEAIAKHIGEFSLAGLKQIAQNKCP